MLVIILFITNWAAQSLIFITFWKEACGNIKPLCWLFTLNKQTQNTCFYYLFVYCIQIELKRGWMNGSFVIIQIILPFLVDKWSRGNILESKLNIIWLHEVFGSNQIDFMVKNNKMLNRFWYWHLVTSRTK